MRTQLHCLCLPYANLCLYPSSGFCLHCATESALTKLLSDVFVTLLFQSYLFSFRYLTLLTFLPWNSLLSLFPRQIFFEFFSCLSFSVFWWGEAVLEGRKVGLFLVLFCPYIVGILQDNLFIPLIYLDTFAGLWQPLPQFRSPSVFWWLSNLFTYPWPHSFTPHSCSQVPVRQAHLQFYRHMELDVSHTDLIIFSPQSIFLLISQLMINIIEHKRKKEWVNIF